MQGLWPHCSGTAFVSRQESRVQFAFYTVELTLLDEKYGVSRRLGLIGSAASLRSPLEMRSARMVDSITSK